MFGFITGDLWLTLLCSVVFALFLALLYVHRKQPGGVHNEDEDADEESESAMSGDDDWDDDWEDEDRDEDAA